MRAVSLKRARVNRERAKKIAVMRSEQDWCSRCGKTGPTSGHERLGRSQGGDITAPDDLLCNPCNTWCEDHPVEAAFDGWKISGKHPRNPELAPGEAWRPCVHTGCEAYGTDWSIRGFSCSFHTPWAMLGSHWED